MGRPVARPRHRPLPRRPPRVRRHRPHCAHGCHGRLRPTRHRPDEVPVPLPADPTVLLGRREEFDPESRRYRINRLRSSLDTELRSVCWPINNLHDQGVDLTHLLDPELDRFGWDPSGCGGFSRGHALMAAPHEYSLSPLDLFRLYRFGQARDEWASTPPEEGTSVLGVSKAAVEMGLVDSYWWGLTQ